MKILFIGGTGLISTAVSRQVVAAGYELYLLNRGIRQPGHAGAHFLQADIHQPEVTSVVLGNMQFDVVVDWIAYTPADIERDLALLRGRTGQFIFISSASVYQKPPTHYFIRESTPLHNPYWQYARDKIASEERLLQAYRTDGYPVTIVRPSLTYDTNLPIAIGGWGTYTLADRMIKGKPVIVHGDGSSLWVVTHAEDFGRGFLGLLGNPQAIGHAFHITSDEVLNWNQIYQTIASALGVEANLVHISSEMIARAVPRLEGTLLGDKAWSTVFDNSKIKSFVPGFQSTIPLRDGIRRTMTWFNADATRKRVDEAVDHEMDEILRHFT